MTLTVCNQFTEAEACFLFVYFLFLINGLYRLNKINDIYEMFKLLRKRTSRGEI